MTAALAVQIATLGVVLAVGWVLVRSHRPPPGATAEPAPAPAPVVDRPGTITRDELDQLVTRVIQLELFTAGLPGLWKEEADRANRAAEREEKSARRNARRREQEDAEPDDDQLQIGNGEGSYPSGVQPMRQAVGSDDTQARLANARRFLALAPLK